MPKQDAYKPVTQALDAALAAKDPTAVEAACRRAQLELARVAATGDFNLARSRAIAQSLRAVARVAPLTTRGEST
jgi:hypothetical protein